MSIQKLIEGETIELCNHHRGKNISIDDRGLHLDKRFDEQSQKRGRVNVRITIDNGISVLDETGEDASTIIKEIKEVFEDREIREGFIKSAKKALTDLARSGRELDSLNNSEELKRKIDTILIGITRYFGKSEDDISTLLYHRNAKAAIEWKPSSKKKVNRNTLYAEVDFTNNSVRLTRNRNMIVRQ